MYAIGMQMAEDNRGTPGAPPSAVRLEFARRLQRALNEKGWTQAELARRMAPLLKESRIGRDNISKYVRGKVLPLPPALEAMAKVLQVDGRELLPTRGTSATAEEHAPLDVRDIGEGRVWLRVNQAVDWNIALQILGLLKGKDNA